MLRHFMLLLALLQASPEAATSTGSFPPDPALMKRVEGSRWEVVVWDHDSAWFLDPARATKIGKQTYRIWLRSDTKQLQHERGVVYDFNLSRLDLRCASYEYRLQDVMLYSTVSDYALVYEWHAKNRDAAAWAQIVPESSFEKVRDEVCGELGPRFGGK